jgi:Siphovirus Gp157
MNITLYQAAQDVRELLEQVDSETGELPEGYEQARAIVATKSKACAAFILENQKQADMVELHAQGLLDKVKQARKRSGWLVQYLIMHMKSSGITEIKSDDGTFRVKLELERDKSVDIYELALLPTDYMREIPAEQEPNKPLIKKAIADGFEVPGARIIAKDRLTIS